MMQRRQNPAALHRKAAQRLIARRFASVAAAVGTVLALALLSSALRASAQAPQYNTGGFQHGQMSDSGSPIGGELANPEMEAKRLDALNAERQKSLVSDTNKLLKLTGELNAQINSTHPDKLTEEQIRMVAEIEKLAHNIREKMCTSVKPAPQFGMPAPVLIPPSIQ